MPRLHRLHLVHNDWVSVPDRLEEDAGHACDTQHSGRRLLDSLKFKEGIDLKIVLETMGRPLDLVRACLVFRFFCDWWCDI